MIPLLGPISKLTLSNDHAFDKQREKESGIESWAWRGVANGDHPHLIIFWEGRWQKIQNPQESTSLDPFGHGQIDTFSTPRFLWKITLSLISSPTGLSFEMFFPLASRLPISNEMIRDQHNRNKTPSCLEHPQEHLSRSWNRMPKLPLRYSL